MSSAIVPVIGLALAATLLWAGFAKLRSGEALARALAGPLRYLEVGRAAVRLLALSEVIVGIALIAAVLGPFPRVAWVATLLFLVFALSLSVAWVRGWRGSCGCYGGGEPVGVGAVARPWICAGFAAIFAASPPPMLFGRLGPLEVLLVVVASTAIAVAIWTLGSLDEAVAQLRTPAPATVRPTNRVTVRYLPLHESLFSGRARRHEEGQSSLTMTEPLHD